MSLALPLQLLVLTLAGWMNRALEKLIDYQRTERAIQDERLAKAGIRLPRLTDEQRLRLAEKAHALGRAAFAQVATIATPETILGWWRKLRGAPYDSSKQRGGRPRTKETATQALLRFARECPTAGYTRLMHMLHGARHEVSRSTVRRILKANGIEPAPERGKKTSWRTFLMSHWEQLAAADFFTVEVLTWTGIQRFSVFFVMELATRRVQVAGIVRDAWGGWMEQVARNLTDGFSGFLRGKTKLIVDRDPLYTQAFVEILKGAGVEVVPTPAHSPNLNPFAERWVRSIREECLSRIIPLGETGLRRAVSAFVEHYHRERPHQGLGGKVIDPEPGHASNTGPIVRRMRLGGLLNYYHRVAV